MKQNLISIVFSIFVNVGNNHAYVYTYTVGESRLPVILELNAS